MVSLNVACTVVRSLTPIFPDLIGLWNNQRGTIRLRAQKSLVFSKLQLHSQALSNYRNILPAELSSLEHAEDLDMIAKQS